MLEGGIPEGLDVVVSGAGLVGCEVAMFLAEKGKNFTMIDMLPEPAPDMPIYTKWVLNSKLAELGIKIKTDHEIVEMTGKHVRCKHDGNITEFIADAVVCALGLKSRKQLTEELRDKLKNTVDIIPVGDTNSPRKIMQAVHEGFHAARRI